MTLLSRAASCVLALLLVAGCASTKVTERKPTRAAARAARSGSSSTTSPPILPRSRPNPSSPRKLEDAGTPTAQQLELSRKVGAEVAKELVKDLRAMGLPAVEAAGQPEPQVDDIVLRGYFVSVKSGSATERVLLGFGAGDAELHTAVEGYQMTAQGLRVLGSGEVQSGGGEVPGMVLPLAVVAATANPIGLIVGGAVKATGEVTGSDTIEGAAKRTADEISAQLKKAAEKQGWI